MKHRLCMLLGAITLTVTSFAGLTALTAPPAGAAQEPAAQEQVDVGYVIDCIFNNLEACLANAIETLLGALDLPTSLGAAATPPAASGSITPPLNLPASTKSIIEKLPPALQTNPVASAPDVRAPITELIPTLKPRAKGSSRAALPKLPSATRINFLNAADHRAASGSPLSAADVAGVAILGVAVLGGLKLRRRAAVTSD